MSPEVKRRGAQLCPRPTLIHRVQRRVIFFFLIFCGKGGGGTIIEGDSGLNIFDGCAGICTDFFMIDDDVRQNDPINILHLFKIHNAIVVPIGVFETPGKITPIRIGRKQCANLIPHTW